MQSVDFTEITFLSAKLYLATTTQTDFFKQLYALISIRPRLFPTNVANGICLRLFQTLLLWCLCIPETRQRTSTEIPDRIF